MSVTAASWPAGAAEPGWTTLAVVLVFVLAGFVKGVVGLGLPTVVMGLLGMLMGPAQAAALLVVPSLATNVWQALAGPGFLLLCRRLAPLLAGIVLGTLAGAAAFGAPGAGPGKLLLGASLAVYAGLALAGWQPAPPGPGREPTISATVGTLTGALTAMTGVFVIPAVPYLQALRLGRSDLIQALGMTFLASTLALGAQLWLVDAFSGALFGASVGALVPAFAGMMLGQWLRSRLDPVRFRRWFLIGLLVLGGWIGTDAAIAGGSDGLLVAQFADPGGRVA